MKQLLSGKLRHTLILMNKSNELQQIFCGVTKVEFREDKKKQITSKIEDEKMMVD
jgi:hypothetical protein